MSHTRLFRFVLILLVVGLIIASWQPVVTLASSRSRATLLQSANPIYVDADAPGPLHDGLSWATAYTDLQTALTTVTAGSEIWVAEGIYTPGETGNRAATFRPQGEVILYGGFAGTETALGERDWVAHPTVLSGDLDRNDLTDLRGVVTDTANITGDNAYHVMTLDHNTTIDGFVITAGQATGTAFSDWNGGGMLINGWSTTLSNLLLSGNMAEYGGGGIYGYGSLTLMGVTVSNNQAGSIINSGYGGGMYTYNGNPTLTNVTFSRNQTTGSGGGIYNSSGSLTLQSVAFDDNQARFGAGLDNEFSSSTLTDVTFTNNHASDRGGGMLDNGGGSTLTNVTFSHNQADGWGGGMSIASYNSTLIGVTFTDNQAIYGGGGGIYNAGTLTLITVTVSGNQATFGAGMFNESGSPTLTDVTFSDNVAEGSGGGMYTAGSYPNATLNRVTFTHNQAREGGGMYNIYPGILSLTAVTFTGNQVSGCGGGMYNGSGSAPTLTEVTFTGNQASDGGGMYNADQASPSLTSVTFANNLSYLGNGGGGMFNSSSNPTLFNVTFTGNSSNGIQGGGGMYNMSSNPVLTNVTFSDNQSGANGGGIYNSSSNPLLTNVAFSNNQASEGGGMYNRDQSAPTLITVTFTDNRANGGSGGGMLNTVSSSPIITYTTFSNNQAFTGGGMENDWDSDPTLTSVTFSGNTASDGGGMRNFQSNPNLINVTFSSNTAYVGGGMENGWDSRPMLTNVTFSGNTAYDGGGMRNYQSSPTLNNVIFSGNQATDNGGGMINEDGSHPTLINTTISNNRAGYFGGGGGLYNADSSPTLVNSILWGNDASTDSEISNLGTSAPDITYSDVAWAEGVYPGTGNLNRDPQFVSPIAATIAPTTTGDYHLLSTSPVIDAGNNFSVTVSLDRDGNPRFRDALAIPDTGLGTSPIVDLGAYEVEDTSVTLTLNTSGNGTITSVPSGPAFIPGTVITLTAAPGTGSSFTGWNGDLNGKVTPITLTLDADKVVTGTFTLNTYRLSLSAIGGGTVTSNPPGPLFTYGTVVTLTAVPNAHSIFTGWHGALNALKNPIIIIMDANKTVLATFQRKH